MELSITDICGLTWKAFIAGAHNWRIFMGSQLQLKLLSWNVCIRAARRQLKVVGSGMGVLHGRKSFLDRLNQNLISRRQINTFKTYHFVTRSCLILSISISNVYSLMSFKSIPISLHIGTCKCNLNAK